MVHDPAATNVSAEPLTVQIPVVLEANVTDKPEVEVADNAGVAVPMVWLPGPVNVMVCGRPATAKLRVTGAAAA
jgi:hypothetical protein